MPIALYDKAQNKKLFEITSEQRGQLAAALEEESAKGHDYYIDADVLDFLDGKVDAALISQLRPLVGTVAPIGGDEAADSDVPDDAPIETHEAPGGIEIVWREE